MNRKQIKQYLRVSMANQFKQIKGYESEEKKEEIFMKKNFRKVAIPLTLITAISFCLCLGITIFTNSATETLVALDVNPAIEMTLNKNEKVIKIEPKNEDAKTILGDMKLKNVDAEVAVNALIGSMLKNGYLKENSNDNNILLTVANDDKVRSNEIKTKLIKTIKNTLGKNNSKAEILLQEDNISKEDVNIAEEYDITVGRAKFINKVLEKAPDLSQEELSKMNIKELVKYLNDKNVDYDDIIEKDDDTLDDLKDKEEDRQDLIKDEKEEEAERIENEQDKIKEEEEKLEEQKKEEQEKLEEQKKEEEEKAEEQKKEEQEKLEEQKKEEEEKLEEQKKEEQEKLEEQKEEEQEKLEDQKEK